MLTYKYRIKDRRARRALCAHAYVIKPERAHLFLPRHGRDRKPVPIGEPLVHEWDGAVRSPWPAPAYQAKLFRKQEARRNA